MLIECPECKKHVSDRAVACPACAFPITEHMVELAAERARVLDRRTRRLVGDVDCVLCEARGFVLHASDDGRTTYDWCSICEHTGRVTLVRSETRYYGVARASVESFVAGAIDCDERTVVDLGVEPPEQARYPRPGRRYGDED